MFQVRFVYSKIYSYTQAHTILLTVKSIKAPNCVRGGGGGGGGGQ